MNEYTIRKAMADELETLYAIFSLTDSLHQKAHPEIFQEISDPSDIKDYLLSRVKADDAVVFVAENQGRIIAAIIAAIHQTRDFSLLIPQTFVSVENLVVAEEFRQQGIGLALMKHVHLWVEERGIKQIQLTVWDFNEGALSFYENLGYKMLHHRMRKELP